MKTFFYGAHRTNEGNILKVVDDVDCLNPAVIHGTLGRFDAKDAVDATRLLKGIAEKVNAVYPLTFIEFDTINTSRVVHLR